MRIWCIKIGNVLVLHSNTKTALTMVEVLILLVFKCLINTVNYIFFFVHAYMTVVWCVGYLCKYTCK
jgi:hypothetical protein